MVSIKNMRSKQCHEVSWGGAQACNNKQGIVSNLKEFQLMLTCDKHRLTSVEIGNYQDIPIKNK